MAQLKGEGTVALHRRTEVCICDVENDRKSTAPFRGWWVVGGGWVVGSVGRKEAAVPLGLRRREDRSLCGEEPSWLGEERRLGPITKTTSCTGPPLSADHGLHICLPFQVILDLICTS